MKFIKTFFNQLIALFTFEKTSRNVKILYFDTNALRALSFPKEFSILAHACKDGKVAVSISEIVVLERGNQYFDEEIIHSKKFPGKSLDNSDHEKIRDAAISAKRELYKNHNFHIISYSKEHKSKVDSLIENKETYFSLSGNDRRDAWILLHAIENYSPQEILFVCQERNLGAEFTKRGYEVRNDSKQLIQEMFGNIKPRKINHPDINAILSDGTHFGISQDLEEEYDNLYPTDATEIKEDNDTAAIDGYLVNLADSDSELRKKIMGYVIWQEPILKEKLETKLIQQGFTLEQVRNNSNRLCIENILKDSGRHFLPNKANSINKELFMQAAASLIDEFLHNLELNE